MMQNFIATAKSKLAQVALVSLLLGGGLTLSLSTVLANQLAANHDLNRCERLLTHMTGLMQQLPQRSKPLELWLRLNQQLVAQLQASAGLYDFEKTLDSMFLQNLPEAFAVVSWMKQELENILKQQTAHPENASIASNILKERIEQIQSLLAQKNISYKELNNQVYLFYQTIDRANLPVTENPDPGIEYFHNHIVRDSLANKPSLRFPLYLNFFSVKSLSLKPFVNIFGLPIALYENTSQPKTAGDYQFSPSRYIGHDGNHASMMFRSNFRFNCEFPSNPQELAVFYQALQNRLELTVRFYQAWQVITDHRLRQSVLWLWFVFFHERAAEYSEAGLKDHLVQWFATADARATWLRLYADFWVKDHLGPDTQVTPELMTLMQNGLSWIENFAQK